MFGVVAASVLAGAPAASADTTIQITSPAGTYKVDQPVTTSFTCTDTTGTITSCLDQNGLQSGMPIDTSTPGTYTLTVTALSSDAGPVTAEVSYTVAGPPTASITSPVDGQTFAVGQSVATAFSCADGAFGPGIATCTDSNGATGGSGTLDTSTPGSFTYSVRPVSRDGQTSTATIHYTVAGAPTVAITSPLNGESYYWASIPAAAFSCAPGVNGTVSSCTASVDGQAVGSGASLPDGLGPHTFTVTAGEVGGQTSTETVTYTSTLAQLPLVSITAPVFDAAYTVGQVVRAGYTCSAVTGGVALRSCVGSVRNGRPINTGSPGGRTFTVTATDVSGQSNSVQLAYRVVATTNRFQITRVSVSPRGVATATLRLPGPGRVSVVATAWQRARALPYGRSARKVSAAGRWWIGVRPNRRGQALLGAPGDGKRLALAVTYAPTGGRPYRVSTRRIRLP